MTGLNKRVLKWARESTGSSVEEVADALGKRAEVIRAWEDGDAAPTYPELEKLAYQVLKRPVAVFFFPEPPPEPTPEGSFRTLPGFEIEDLSAETRYRIRQALARQLALDDFFGGKNPAPEPLVRKLATRGADARSVASRLREILGVSVETQASKWRSARQAAQEWRLALDREGVFVFKDSIKQREVSGFCLNGSEFPIIVLNNGTSFARQSFTLFHELGHLLSRTGGVTKANEGYLRALKGEAKRIEVFCNHLAAEVLVPEDDFRVRARGLRATDEAVGELAATYKVSRETVLRRFLEAGRIDRASYEAKAAKWRSDYERDAGDESGGNYYRTQVSYLSPSFLEEVFRRYVRGDIPADGAASLLGVKPSSLAGLEEIVLQKVPA